MSEPFLFLDYNSTTPLDSEIAQAMAEKQPEAWGNPSSVHAAGRQAKKLLEEARERTAAQIHCDPGELYFTSGGTESDNLALKGCYFGDPRKPRRVAVSAIEHSAVLGAADDLRKLGAEVISIPASSGGVVTPEALEVAARGGVAVAAVMAANNETGTLQPVRELAARAHELGTRFHCDAVQAIGKVRVDVRAWDVDLLALTAHKFYGPRGIGALFVRRGVPLAAQISGGGHERNRRAGTENVIGAYGLALALEKANRLLDDEEPRLRELSEHFIKTLRQTVPGTHFHGDPNLRVANTVSCSFEGVEGESVVVSLDLKGLCVASGSACSSGATEPSHVILALGVEPRLAAGAVRFSFGRSTDRSDIDRLLAELPPIVERLRALSPSYVGHTA
jgi:cysteine desulfurase